METEQQSPRQIARSYFEHWTAGRIDAAADLLAEDIRIETPINAYARKEDFVAALAGFSPLVMVSARLVDLAGADEAVQIYDMTVTGLGTIRVVEHFVVDGGRITVLRQVHDTAALRAAGFERPSA